MTIHIITLRYRLDREGQSTGPGPQRLLDAALRLLTACVAGG